MTSPNRWLILACLAITPCFSYGDDTAALTKRLQDAADASSLDDPSLKPWHLKINVQMYDEKGDPSEKGTVEEWWSPDADKRSYDTPSYKAVELRIGEKYYRTKTQTAAPYLLEAMRKGVVHPMAMAKAVDASRPELRTWSPGKMKLDCIMLEVPNANIPSPSLGTFPTYCFEPGDDMLRVSMKSGSELVTRSAFGHFQDRNIALDQTLINGSSKAASAHVAVLETNKSDASLFLPGVEMEERPAPIQSPGRALKTVAPVYPFALRGKHIFGSVHLAATIDKDGHIANPRITDAPDPSLAASALLDV